MEQSDLKYLPNVLLSGKYLAGSDIYDDKSTYTHYEGYGLWRLQLSKKLPYHFIVNAGVDNLFDYITPTTSFYSTTSPGRTYFVGLKWNL